MSSLSGISGLPVATLREGQKQIPVVTRLRMDERAQLADLHNLYVYGEEKHISVFDDYGIRRCSHSKAHEGLCDCLVPIRCMRGRVCPSH